MAFKLVALFGFVAACSAVSVLPSPGHHVAPAVFHAPQVVQTFAAPVYKQVAYEHEAPAQYEFNYSVHDEHTGDIKSQHEVRNGNNVQGFYELIDSDGHKRTVHYTADEHAGFNAVVDRQPTDIKIPVPVPVAYHAQAPAQFSSVHYAPAPVAKLVAPVAKLAAPVAHYSSPLYHH